MPARECMQDPGISVLVNDVPARFSTICGTTHQIIAEIEAKKYCQNTKGMCFLFFLILVSFVHFFQISAGIHLETTQFYNCALPLCRCFLVIKMSHCCILSSLAPTALHPSGMHDKKIEYENEVIMSLLCC